MQRDEKVIKLGLNSAVDAIELLKRAREANQPLMEYLRKLESQRAGKRL
jgi:hypothetical protein